MADTGGGQTRPMPPLTNKDTPPFHCNEFNYMSSRRTVVARADLLCITPDTRPFFYCAFERPVRTLRISIAVRKVVDLRSPRRHPDPMAKTIAEVFAASKKCMCQ